MVKVRATKPDKLVRTLEPPPPERVPQPSHAPCGTHMPTQIVRKDTDNWESLPDERRGGLDITHRKERVNSDINWKI